MISHIWCDFFCYPLVSFSQTNNKRPSTIDVLGISLEMWIFKFTLWTGNNLHRLLRRREKIISAVSCQQSGSACCENFGIPDLLTDYPKENLTYFNWVLIKEWDDPYWKLFYSLLCQKNVFDLVWQLPDKRRWGYCFRDCGVCLQMKVSKCQTNPNLRYQFITLIWQADQQKQ